MVHKMASEVGARKETKNKLGWERKTTRRREGLADSFSAWFRGGRWDIQTRRLGPFLPPGLEGGRVVVKGVAGREKAKGYCSGPPESQGKGESCRCDVKSYGAGCAGWGTGQVEKTGR